MSRIASADQKSEKKRINGTKNDTFKRNTDGTKKSTVVRFCGTKIPLYCPPLMAYNTEKRGLFK